MKIGKYFVFMLCIGLAMGCKKDLDPPTPEPVDTKEELIRDSIYYYYNLQSLWTEYVPDNSVLRTFTASYTSNDNLLNALKGLTPFHAGYNGSIDRFSFLEGSGEGSQLSSSVGLRMDTNDGYGMYVGWRTISETTAEPVLYLVEGGSPAQRAGITRGAILLSLNGDENMTAPYDCPGTGENRPCYVRGALPGRIDAALNAPSMRARMRLLNGEEHDYNLANETYEIKPILADTVYSGTKNIGYLAFSSFEEVTSANQNYQDFQRIFQRFETAGIKDLIVDIRYNTGGYVNTAQYLADKIISATGNGARMFTYEVNANLQPYTVRAADGYDFRPVNFARKNNLELQTVYFLVTETTASAAELLINVLKPHMNVVLIADDNRTFGKPVGFFGQEIMGGETTLWAASFKTLNSRGETDYWDGLNADVPNVYNDLARNFGDPREGMIAHAIGLSNGVGSMSTLNRSSVSRGAASTTITRRKLNVINKPVEKNLIKEKE
ncbi:S41 family peptidase [Sphingobacterium deserti]|uniref:Peptidase S41 n=1 Tax=Sphingobacterium deserti TaxID=1229276 RepID=A0A0B8TAB5_9SPHI|nr:S41 family peptidase [Sphingobacterium deserti]KGE15015.1 peptidase S41 [Sphingobacterium deserti]